MSNPSDAPASPAPPASEPKVGADAASPTAGQKAGEAEATVLEAEPSDPRIGTLLGKYRIARFLGRGGMGAVYEGEDTMLKRRVAVKFLPEEMLRKPEVIERFIREAQISGRLNHPNIPAIFDVARDERECYMVMELLSPISATGRLKTKGAYRWEVATRIIADCCMALKVAHQANLVHRDIKPDNILFATTGVVKLVDFGLVKVLDEDLHLTQSGVVCGTPHYMSPEQASGHELDARSDLYSLGATYFALLTARPPFIANGLPQVLLAHVSAPIPDPRDVVREIPEAVAEVISRSMAKRPEERYQSAEEMGVELENILASSSISSQRNQSVFVLEESSLNAPTLSGAGTVKSESIAGQRISSPSGLRRSLGPGQKAHEDTVPVAATGVSRRQILLGGGLLTAMLGGAGVFALRDRNNPRGGSKTKGSTLDNPDATPTPKVVQNAEPIKVGILHSLSGSLAISERPLADASLLAIEEINGRGGLLGRSLQPVVVDGKSEVTHDSAFTRGAEKLLSKDKVAAVFGGFGSAGRKQIRPYFEKYDALLFYPSQYEGLEESQNIIYTGATPNQLAVPTVRYCVDQLKAKRFFVIGTDGLRAHAINAIIEDTVKELGGSVVGSYYSLVGEVHFDPVVKKITKSRPDIILNTLVGDSSVAFFKALVEGKILPEDLPVMSFTIGENELAMLGSMSLLGHYVARTRFPTLAGVKNDPFAVRFRKKYGDHRAVSEGMESAYYGVHLWAAAIEHAKSEDVNKVRNALKEKEFDLEGVRVHVDASNQHTWKVFEIGRIERDNKIQSLKTGDAPLPPIPFPGPRTRAEWEEFAETLFKKWGGNFANPQKPGGKKNK